MNVNVSASEWERTEQKKKRWIKRRKKEREKEKRWECRKTGRGNESDSSLGAKNQGWDERFG